MTMINVNITRSGALLTNQAPQIIQTGLDRLVTAVTLFLAAEVKKRVPQGVFGAQGGLLGSIQHEVVGKGTPVIKGIVMSAQKYAEVVEKGRLPGRGMPPAGSLVRWLEVKLGLDEKTARKIEFVVRRKIGLKGFEGAHMFEKAVTENQIKLDQMAQAEGFKLAIDLT
jgi:hypothetical protein